MPRFAPVPKVTKLGSMTAVQRLQPVVDTTSMHGHGHEAVIGPALIAHAELPLMHVQRTSHAAGRAEIARTTAVTSRELAIPTHMRPSPS
jgi:hypothetical protein